MILKEFIIKRLINVGLNVNTANEVFEYAARQNDLSTFSRRWYDDVNDYELMLVGIIIKLVYVHVFEWLLENQPNAWYVPYFCIALKFDGKEDNVSIEIDIYYEAKKAIFFNFPTAKNKGKLICDWIEEYKQATTKQVNVKVDSNIKKGFGR